MNEWFADDRTGEDGREAKYALTQARLEDTARMLAQSPDGRFFLRWLIHGAGVFRAAFPQGHAEAAFMEGKRSVGLSVLQLCANVGAAACILNTDEVNDG